MAEYSNRRLRKDIDSLEDELREKAIAGTLSIKDENLLNMLRTEKSYGKKFAQGSTVGASDEISAFATSLLPNENRDLIIKELSQRTGENVTPYDVDLAQYRRDLRDTGGVGATSAEMAGAVLPYVLGGKTKLLRNVMNPKTYKGAAGAGAADSGLYGFFVGEGGFKNRLAKSGLYGSGGLVGGPILKGITNMVSKAYRGIKPPANEEAIKQARKIIADTLQIEGMTVKDAMAKLLESKGSKLVLADLGETNQLTNYLQAVREINPPAYAEAAKILREREKGKAERISHLFSGGSKTGNLLNNLMVLKAAREKEARPLYTKAFYNVNNKTGTKTSLKAIPINEELNEIFKTPNFVKVFESAKKLALEENKKFPFMLSDGAIIDATTGKKINKIPTLYLHYMKKGYDDFLSTMYKQTDVGTLQTAAIQNNKNKLVNFLNQDANYNKAREIYSGSYETGRALQLGDTILKPSVGYQDIVRQLKNMTKSERESFRIGAIDRLRDKIESGNIDQVLRSFLKSEKMKKILKLSITGNANLNRKSKKFDNFYNTLINEMQTKITNNRVLGGSKTSDVLQTTANLQRNIPDISLNASSIARSLLGDAMIEGNQKYNQALGKEISRILTTFSPDDLKVLDKEIKEGKTWKEIIKTYPNVFKTLLQAPFSPQGLGFTIQEAGEIGYGDEYLGQLSGALESIGILQ